MSDATLLILSDSHGRPDRIREAIRRTRPDGILFAGDGLHDLADCDLPCPLRAVKGNCDFSTPLIVGGALLEANSEELFTLAGIRILLTHGHHDQVKGGLGLLAALTLFLPSRILLVEVQGNAVIPENRILETAAQCGIRFWASRREVRSEGMKNALLEAMPELSWAGINTYGSRAVITVREGRDGGEETEPPLVSSIVAALDGFILSCQAERGTALCAPGQGVKAGDVLISGYTDCGLCVTATRSLGEVMAVTQRQIAAITPADCLKKGARKGEEVTYSLILGKFRINFDNNSGISPPGCGRMVTEYTLTLPGNFSLPVKLQKQTVNGYALTKTDVTEDAAGALLSRFAADHLQAQMIAGAVTEALETIHAEDGRWVLTGNYACTEMIGRERAEQNGE